MIDELDCKWSIYGERRMSWMLGFAWWDGVGWRRGWDFQCLRQTLEDWWMFCIGDVWGCEALLSCEKSGAHNSPLCSEWCIESWQDAPGSRSSGSSGDVTLRLTFWPFNELQPKDSRVYALLGSGVITACHVTCFSFLFKAWQISTIRSPVGLKPRLARHAAVCSASARHLTHFSFIPTSGAVCLDLTPRACLRYSLRGCDTICDSCSSWRHHERRNINSSSIWCLKWCYRCSKKINPVCLLLIFSLYLYLFAHTSYLTGGLN